MESIDRTRDTITYHLPDPRHEWWGLLMIAGIVLIAATFVPSGIAILDEGALGTWLLRLFALLMIATSIAVFTRQRAVRVDRRNRTVEILGGWTRLRRMRLVALDDIPEVRISKALVQSQRRTRTYYRIDLAGPGLAIEVGAELKYPRVRAQAEILADFIQKPLRDNATPIYRGDGAPVDPRAPNTLDATVAGRAAEAVPPSFPPAPADCRIRVRREGDRVLLELPVIRRTLGAAFFLSAIAMATAAGVAWAIGLYVDPDLPPGARVLLYSLPGFAGIVLPVAILAGAFNGRREEELIAVTPLVLSTEVRRCWTRRADELPVDAIEEIGFTAAAASRAQRPRDDLRPPYPMSLPAIAARTDFKSMTLGRGLFQAEQTWLHDVLRYLLAHATTETYSSGHPDSG